VAVTDGLIGFSLLARPLRKHYATLSVWTDEDALARFADTEPHRDLMRALSHEMDSTRFVRWTIRGSDGRPSWDDALNRLR
jgi:heme-degrading monooxygenase HmoA